MLVYIGRSLGDRPIEDFAVRAFEQWRPGSKEKDDGLVLFVFPEDRKIRIEVGYGLEGDVPDAAASQIINGVMAPHLREGNADAAIEGAVASLLERLQEPPCAVIQARVADQAAINLAFRVVFGVMFGMFVLFFILAPRAALRFLFQLAVSSGGGRGWQRVGGGGSWGGGGGSWGGGGGGFSGGGGSSGGGGASGGW